MNFFAYFNPKAFELFETIKDILNFEFFFLENFIKDFKLLPLPEIKTAVLLYSFHLILSFNFIFIITILIFT